MARGQSQVRVHSGVAEQSFYHAKQMGADDYLDFISFFQRDAERNKHFQKVLKDALDIRPYDNPDDKGYQDKSEEALDEVKDAIKQLQDGVTFVELSPQDTNIRKLQHELVEQYGFKSVSIGENEIVV